LVTPLAITSHNGHSLNSSFNSVHSRSCSCSLSELCDVVVQDQRDGLILVQTKSHILMASYTRSMYASVAVEAVEQLGGYTRSVSRHAENKQNTFRCCNVTNVLSKLRARAHALGLVSWRS